MDHNFLNYNSDLAICDLCVHDSNIGYSADFSVNGEVDYWTYHDGIHTYGCWNNFLFGTLYGDYALIGRYYNIFPIDGESYYILQISMLLKSIGRTKDQMMPNKAKFMWVTLEKAQWSEDKSVYFDIVMDSNWHTYVVDLSSKQKWVGNISNLRIYPIYANGKDGDEFFIKSIQIKSKDNYSCSQVNCSAYSVYAHPCVGRGSKPYCESIPVSKDSINIVKGYNNYLILNINGYGDEIIVVDYEGPLKLQAISKKLTRAIGSLNIGGYAEAQVTIDTDLRFRIYSGTTHGDSTVIIKYTKLAEEMCFFSGEIPCFIDVPGLTPASSYVPKSTFNITPSQTIDLMDSDINSFIEFNPSLYSIEAGRSDWYLSGLGIGLIRVISGDESSLVKRDYEVIGGPGKTLIDFSHPFNASGRISKAYVCGTSDYGFERIVGPDGALYSNGEWGLGRLYTTGVKLKIFRPRNNGLLEVVAEATFVDRDLPSTVLTSSRQEYTEIDCDLFVNKGDLLGVYNISLYYGRTLNYNTIDASYYEIEGDLAIGTLFDPGQLKGDGNAGLLIYARSNQKQNNLSLQIDLKNRINVKSVKIKGFVIDNDIEYNLMRCVDFTWDVNLFGRSHNTQFRHALDMGRIYRYTVPNTTYGINRLNDGIYTVPNGRAADSFIMVGPTTGVVPNNPYYFFVNGDQEWLKVHYWPEYWRGYCHVDGFVEDPIAFTIIFPYGKYKDIHRFKIHFKEYWNFRSFALSTYVDPLYADGDADDPRFSLIDSYEEVLLDGRIFKKENAVEEQVDKYLFSNPSIGHPIIKVTGGPGWEFPGDAIIPGTGVYTSYGNVTNAEQFTQSKQLDWKILEHRWSPLSCKGFRFYCSYHESTKICEMELFGYIKGGIAKIAAGVMVLTSSYGDYWDFVETTEDEDHNAVCEVNNSIRYIDIDLNPINITYLSGIDATLTDESLIFGEKGCVANLILADATYNEINDYYKIPVQNVYVDNATLMVSIPVSSKGEHRTLYYSSLENDLSIKSPFIGPSAFYKKEADFSLLNSERNVAINSDCFGLKNMVLGSTIFYSYNIGCLWLPFFCSV